MRRTVHHRFSARLAAAASIAGLLLTGFGCTAPNNDAAARLQPLTLTYWRVFDDSDSFYQIVADYNKIHANVYIDYRKFTYEEYQRKLLSALAEDTGPDIFSLPSAEMRAWQDRLLPMPGQISMAYKEVKGSIKKDVTTVIRNAPGISARQFSEQFVDVALNDMVLELPQTDPRAEPVPAVYGLPLSVDTLAMYYNRTMLNNAGIPSPATDWKTFQDHAKQLTKLDETGAILQSGAALGTSANVQRSSDILSLLMLQNGTQMTDLDGTATFDRYPPELAGRPLPPGAEALVFYSDFANPEKEVYSWNDKMPDSLQAFAAGQTAYFFGYSYHAPQIRALNAKLDFGIAAFPQISASNQPVAFANYWGEVVSKKTKYPNEAWDFLTFVAKAEEAQKFLAATQKPSALKSLSAQQVSDPNVGVFASQLPNARTWYRGTKPDVVDSAFAEMVRQVLAAVADPRKAVELAAVKVNQTIQ